MTSNSIFRVDGATAVVTGASGNGLGFHAARCLGQQGATVILSDHPRMAEDLEQAVSRLREDGITAHGRAADITDTADLEALDAFSAQIGAVDVLVNAAGAMLRRPTLETSDDDWDRIVDVNMTGTFKACRQFGRGMVQRKSGRIVNVSTVYTNIVGALPEAAYYASKAGVANLTRGLAAEWGRFGVRVNCIAPGVFFPTRMTQPLADDAARLSVMEARTMLGRLGKPDEDLDGTIAWLSSRASEYVTGQVIFVDGGWSAW